MSWAPTAFPGTLHHYHPRLTAFEHSTSSSESSLNISTKHTILFLGGLGDGLLNPSYTSLLATYVKAEWSICEVLLSSSYSGWTKSTLLRDANELALAVAYFRSLPGRSVAEGAKLILLGHSTGSQICMEYLVGPWKETPVPRITLERPKIDGVILQAGISDREGLGISRLSAKKQQECMELARSWMKEGRGEDLLPHSATEGVFGSDPSARRYISLAETEGVDDYFSSDLKSDILDRTFGTLGQRSVPLCILISGEDEYMPKFVDKAKLVESWTGVVKRFGGIVGSESGVVEGATHNMNRSDEDVRDKFCQRVCSFVEKVARGEVQEGSASSGRL